MTDHEVEGVESYPDCLFNPDSFCYNDGCPYGLLDYCLTTYERSLNE